MQLVPISESEEQKMQSTPVGPQGYSPDLDAEGSFPERHLDDDKVVPGPSSAAGPRRFHPGTPNHRLAFEPSLPTVYARDWPGPNQALPLDTQVCPGADADILS